jgi:hypothetical protein
MKPTKLTNSDSSTDANLSALPDGPNGADASLASRKKQLHALVNQIKEPDDLDDMIRHGEFLAALETRTPDPQIIHDLQERRGRLEEVQGRFNNKLSIVQRLEAEQLAAAETLRRLREDNAYIVQFTPDELVNVENAASKAEAELRINLAHARSELQPIQVELNALADERQAIWADEQLLEQHARRFRHRRLVKKEVFVLREAEVIEPQHFAVQQDASRTWTEHQTIQGRRLLQAAGIVGCLFGNTFFTTDNTAPMFRKYLQFVGTHYAGILASTDPVIQEAERISRNERAAEEYGRWALQRGRELSELGRRFNGVYSLEQMQEGAQAK